MLTVKQFQAVLICAKLKIPQSTVKFVSTYFFHGTTAILFNYFFMLAFIALSYNFYVLINSLIFLFVCAIWQEPCGGMQLVLFLS